MIYPMPIILNHGGSGVSLAVPTWVQLVTVVGVGLSVTGILGVIAIVVHDLLMYSYSEKGIFRMLAIFLIGLAISIIGLVLMLIIGKPIE